MRVNDKEDEDDADETMVPNIVIAREQMRLPHPSSPAQIRMHTYLITTYIAQRTNCDAVDRNVVP